VERPARSGFARVPFVRPCAVVSDGAEHAGLVCNLSLLGAYVHLDPMPALRDPVRMRFELPDGEAPVEVVATVSWIHDASAGNTSTLPIGCGLRFVEIAPADLRRLAGLVAAFPSGSGARFGLSQPHTGKVRIPFVAPCALVAGESVARGSVCNLSTAGIYVAVDEIPEVGKPGIVAFRLPGDVDLFERTVVVAWRNPDGPRRVRILPPGCGLRFVNLSATDLDRLARLVDDYVGAATRAPA